MTFPATRPCSRCMTRLPLSCSDPLSLTSDTSVQCDAIPAYMDIVVQVSARYLNSESHYLALSPARFGYNRRLIRDCRRLPQRSAALASEVLYFVRTDDGGMSIENHRHRGRLDDSSLEYDLTNRMIKVNKILKLSCIETKNRKV